MNARGAERGKGCTPLHESVGKALDGTWPTLQSLLPKAVQNFLGLDQAG